MWVRYGLQLDRFCSSVGREQESKAECCRFDPGFLHNLFFSVKVVGALVLLFFLLNQNGKVA